MIKNKAKSKTKKYVYALKGDLEILKGLTLSFKAVNRLEADAKAKEEALIFGENVTPKFLKEV
jgi:hypothetical protein